MGILSKLTKAGVAKKAMTEAQKPENQRKLKGLVAKAQSKRGTRPR